MTQPSAFVGVLRRELLIRFRSSVGWLTPLLFFLAMTTVFAIALGPEVELLSSAAPGVLWSAALFASLLTQEGILQADIDNGFAEQMVLSKSMLVGLVLAKALAHWLGTGLLLVLASPLAGLALGLPVNMLPQAAGFLLLGTLTFSLLAAFVAAVATSTKNSVLTTLLALPLAVPALIFGTIASRNLLVGDSVLSSILLLLAALTFALTVLPLATAGALRVSAGFA